MSGLHEVACGACGKRHVMSAARAREQRVLRCDCGQFVRLDRALAEARSDPSPAPTAAADLADADDDDDEHTHMLSSLEAIAALGSGAGRPSQASLHQAEANAAIDAAASASNLPQPSTPPARLSSPAHRPSSPVQAAATEKPLWYVDLGGTETVEMTIEQLIIARRSGKLGEGALVWRAGMPHWRSVGSLIPAAGSAPRQTIQPAAPVRNKPPAPDALGSYERPLATLEFAFEKPEDSPAPERPSRPPNPLKSQSASQPPLRIPTPMPRARGASQVGPFPTPIPRVRGASQVGPFPTPIPRVRGASQVGPLPLPSPIPRARGASQVGPLPAPPRLPSVMLRTPVPIAPPSTPPTPVPSVSMVSPLMQRSSPMPPAHSVIPAAFNYPGRGPRPRWLSVGIAVLLCIVASGSGAFVVRALKIRRQPLSLSPTQVSAAPAATSLALPRPTAQVAPPAAANSTEIVDVNSLSVERRAPRPVARVITPPALPAAVAPAPAAPPNPEKGANSDESDDTSEPVAAPPSTAKKTNASDLPTAARSNPYTTGTTDDAPAKKPAPPNDDEPGL